MALNFFSIPPSVGAVVASPFQVQWTCDHLLEYGEVELGNF